MDSIKNLIIKSWDNLNWNIVQNPALLFDKISFTEAIQQKNFFFQPKTLPTHIKQINLETSKRLHACATKAAACLNTINLKEAEETIALYLQKCNILKQDQELFCTLLLTTLPGWAAEIARQAESAPDLTSQYLAFRLKLTHELWPESKKLIAWYKKQDNLVNSELFDLIKKEEKKYLESLLEKMRAQTTQKKHKAAAQFFFCVDVREESFRHALETHGAYATYGYAGSLGLPLEIKDQNNNSWYQSCPSFVQPKHQIHDSETPSIETISITDQTTYVETVLRTVGLIKNFAPLLVICGHRGESERKIYESMLHCGACNGNPGGVNARVFAQMINNPAVRKNLQQKNIHIPAETICIAAEHNTTTDDVYLWTNIASPAIESLKKDLAQITIKKAKKCPRSGLAGNASLIIGPRSLTENSNLHDHAFLHSYDYTIDSDGNSLQNILLGALRVALSINIRYLFSTLHNNSYKVDLTFGIPPALIYNPDQTPRHKLRRLAVIVYAPKSKLNLVIKKNEYLQKLFTHQWAHLVCIDPESEEIYLYE